jgi:hypothetical protein
MPYPLPMPSALYAPPLEATGAPPEAALRAAGVDAFARCDRRTPRSTTTSTIPVTTARINIHGNANPMATRIAAPATASEFHPATRPSQIY